MTTNVFDGGVGLVATDSRWSYQQGRWLVYIDDSNFDKLELYTDTAFVFAGKAWRIQEWKDWIRSSPTDLSGMPSVDELSVCITDMATGAVKFAERQDIVNDGAYFAGSGARHAFKCWEKNRDARRSIESAKLSDPCTGGEIKYVEFDGRRHNLCRIAVEMNIHKLQQDIDKRGNVMDLSQGQGTALAPFKLTELAANDRELSELQAKIANGDVSLEAPCDGMHSEWTADQRDKLRAALKDVFKIA